MAPGVAPKALDEEGRSQGGFAVEKVVANRLGVMGCGMCDGWWFPRNHISCFFHFSIVKDMFKGKMSRRKDSYLLRGNDRSRFFSGVNAILLVC